VLAAAVMEVLTAGKQEISLRQSNLFCIAPLVHGRTGPRPRGILTLSQVADHIAQPAFGASGYH